MRLCTGAGEEPEATVLCSTPVSLVRSSRGAGLLLEERFRDESPDLDVPPLRDYVNVSELMPSALIFIKNPEYFDININSNINSFSREKSLDSNSLKKNNREKIMIKI